MALECLQACTPAAAHLWLDSNACCLFVLKQLSDCTLEELSKLIATLHILTVLASTLSATGKRSAYASRTWYSEQRFVIEATPLLYPCTV
jgi:hypothetical protein